MAERLLDGRLGGPESEAVESDAPATAMNAVAAAELRLAREAAIRKL